jgi:hypothetical protein
VSYEPISAFAEPRLRAWRRTNYDYAALVEQWECEHSGYGPMFDDARLDMTVQPKQVLAAACAHLDGETDLTLLGGLGTGKTNLAHALLREHHFMGRSIAFVNATDLTRANVEDLSLASVLVIDDWGAHNDTPTQRENTYRIFNYRYDQQVQTIITSNLNADDFIDRIGERAADRLTGPIITVSGASRRKDESYLDVLGVNDVKDTANYYVDALARVRSQIANDKRGETWTELLVAEGLYELLDESQHAVDPWTDRPAFLHIVRYMYGEDADGLLGSVVPVGVF